jgi:phage terminase small subunit
MPGPGKKPKHLKVVAGTSRKDREPAVVVDLPVIDQPPEPADWLLNAHAINEWKRLARILTANKLLTEGGLSALGMLCNLHGEIVRQTSVGMMPPAHLFAQYRAMANDFGLTPVAQGKVKPSAEKEKPGGRFAGIGKKPTAAG